MKIKDLKTNDGAISTVQEISELIDYLKYEQEQMQEYAKDYVEDMNDARDRLLKEYNNIQKEIKADVKSYKKEAADLIEKLTKVLED